jgi:hypothetical protein
MFGQDNQGVSTDTSTTQPVLSDDGMSGAMPNPYTPASIPMPSVISSAPQSAPTLDPPQVSTTQIVSSSSSYLTPPNQDSSNIAPAENVTPTETVAPEAEKSPENSSADLMEIKKNALEQLSPLVGKLEQTPEEKFHTTMMMIQASDNQDLVKDAYEAAQKISDEKEKAQALLDVVNEINYFTQKASPATE